MNNKQIFLSFLLAFLLLISGCTSLSQEDLSSSMESSSSQSEPKILDVAFTFASDGKDAGTEQTLTDQQENYAYGVSFPAFDQEKVDSLVREQTQKLIDRFQNQVSAYSARSHGRRASLKVDYQDHLVGDHIAALLLKVQTDIPGDSFNTQILPFLFDLTTGKQLTYNDFFNDQSQDSVFKQVLSHFPSSDSALAVTADEFSDLFRSDSGAVSNFVLSGDNVVFYYDSPSLFISRSGQLAISVPISELDGQMKVDQNGNAKKPPEKPQPPKQDQSKPKPKPEPEESSAVSPPPAPKPKPQPGTVDPSKLMVALTFDDGPSNVTPRILNTLEQYHARATFFVLGSQVKGYHAHMQRALSLGCEIGNHTTSHASLPGLDLDSLASQIGGNNQRICDYISQSPTLLRPPYGATNDTVRANAGMPLILWNIDTEDWKSRNAQSVINRALDHVKDGDIILMHDLYGSTADACETIIPELISRGFQLVTVSEMAQAKGVALENGKLYYSIR
ncbi:MAG: polysaccharide deacetylase family protein [Clostridiales bacterium]|nr:polysaccharide deacetylase family protein [Clostridiales bacterium]